MSGPGWWLQPLIGSAEYEPEPLGKGALDSRPSETRISVAVVATKFRISSYVAIDSEHMLRYWVSSLSNTNLHRWNGLASDHGLQRTVLVKKLLLKAWGSTRWGWRPRNQVTWLEFPPEDSSATLSLLLRTAGEREREERETKWRTVKSWAGVDGFRLQTVLLLRNESWVKIKCRALTEKHALKTTMRVTIKYFIKTSERSKMVS